MITIHYENETTVTGVEPGMTLLEISLQNNIPHIHACGGNARCSTCRVAILENPENCEARNPAESELASRKGLDRHIRLACQTRVHGPIKIRRLVMDDEDLQEASLASSSGQEKHLAILFSDIRSFTPFAEANLPYDVVHIMNRYFRRMGDAVQRHHGYIDKYIGDGLMALFGLENGDRDAAAVCRNAVLAGLDMQAGLQEVNRYLRHHLDTEFRIGIGIHFGEVIVGDIGHPAKRQFTALGDNVNMASRIESVTKQAGVPMLISQDVFSVLKQDVVVERRFRTALKGKSGEYRVYSIQHLRGAPEADNANAESRLKSETETPTLPAQAPAAAVPADPGTESDAPVQYHEVSVLEVQTVAESTLAFLLDTSGIADFQYHAGQYVNVRLLDSDDVRSFSIASAPHIEDFILIGTRIRDSAFKQSLAKLRPGDRVWLGPPEGSYRMPDDPEQPVVFVVGGIGITPVRSMIEEAVFREQRRPILLLYANRHPNTTPFLPELQEWMGHLPEGRLVSIFSREQIPGNEYGRLDGPLIRRLVDSFEQELRAAGRSGHQTLFYVVGPDSMTLDLVGILEAEGVSPEQIRLEAFYGYQ